MQHSIIFLYLIIVGLIAGISKFFEIKPKKLTFRILNLYGSIANTIRIALDTYTPVGKNRNCRACESVQQNLILIRTKFLEPRLGIEPNWV